MLIYNWPSRKKITNSPHRTSDAFWQSLRQRWQRPRDSLWRLGAFSVVFGHNTDHCCRNDHHSDTVHDQVSDPRNTLHSLFAEGFCAGQGSIPSCTPWDPMVEPLVVLVTFHFGVSIGPLRTSLDHCIHRTYRRHDYCKNHTFFHCLGSPDRWAWASWMIGEVEVEGRVRAEVAARCRAPFHRSLRCWATAAAAPLVAPCGAAKGLCRSRHRPPGRYRHVIVRWRCRHRRAPIRRHVRQAPVGAPAYWPLTYWRFWALEVVWIL